MDHSSATRLVGWCADSHNMLGWISRKHSRRWSSRRPYEPCSQLLRPSSGQQDSLMSPTHSSTATSKSMSCVNSRLGSSTLIALRLSAASTLRLSAASTSPCTDCGKRHAPGSRASPRSSPSLGSRPPGQTPPSSFFAGELTWPISSSMSMTWSSLPRARH